MLSCKEVSLLTSKSMDTTLTRREQLAVRLHLLYCRGCTQFRDQLQFLRRAAQRSSKILSAGTVRLPAAARDRIQSALRRER
jgi:hypothetical protein